MCCCWRINFRISPSFAFSWSRSWIQNGAPWISGMNEDQSFFRDLFFIGAYQEENLFRRKTKNRKRNMQRSDLEEESNRRCRHVLDLYRRNFLGDERSYPTHNSGAGTGICGKSMGVSVWDVKEQVMASFRNVKELMAAGIRIKRSPTRFLRNVSFSSNGITASLRLPTITIDNSTKTLFLNLIACEMSSDVEHDFISYLRLLDSLIDQADDVKELQSVGVVQNNLGTHEQVAEFFNTVSANLESNFHAYKDVRVKIRKHQQSHYNSRVKMWITECLDTYFGTPWAIIAWVAAFLALFLTALQTYFQVFPSSNST